MLTHDTRRSRLSAWAANRLRARNAVSGRFFPEQAHRFADVSRQMAARFLRGGRLIAFGRGPYATDAQHVAVEFVHPVIVGKRALPALDLSGAYRTWVAAVLRPEDIALGFGPPEGDADVLDVLAAAAARGALAVALPGRGGDYAFESPAPGDPFIHQEMFEVAYHTLWETVHVFLEHQTLGHTVGAAGFLYPFLGVEPPDMHALAEDVASSIVTKAQDDEGLRERIARDEADRIAGAILAVRERLHAGGKLVLFGNGGSATDANDWAIDCVAPPAGYRPIPAVSLSMEPAVLTAIANDVGRDVMFLRQLIAQAGPEDVAVGLSTSGGSENVNLALEEARTRGLLTLAVLGCDGGETLRRGLADFAFVVRSDYIPRIQEAQASLYHLLREGLEVSPPEHA